MFTRKSQSIGRYFRSFWCKRSTHWRWVCLCENTYFIFKVRTSTLTFSCYFFGSWGGCIVAICDSLEKSAKYINELKEKYFKLSPEYAENDADNVVFVTNPQRGAAIYLNKQ